MVNGKDIELRSQWSAAFEVFASWRKFAAVQIRVLKSFQLRTQGVFNEFGKRQSCRKPRQMKGGVTSFVEHVNRNVERGSNFRNGLMRKLGHG